MSSSIPTPAPVSPPPAPPSSDVGVSSLPPLSDPLSTPTPSASDSGASASASGSGNGGSSASVSASSAGGGGGGSSSAAPGSSSSAPASVSSPTVLASPSVSVGQSAVLSTSNGVVVTNTIRVTSTVPAGTTLAPSTHVTTAATNHTGAIAGGVVGGVALLLLLAVLVWALMRRARERRKRAEFDGNFDPGRTTAGAGPTLPQLDGGADGYAEDDGVGGRLAASAVGGGVLTPFMGGAGHQQHQQQYTPANAYYGTGGGYEGEQAPLSPSTMSTSLYPASSSAHAGPHTGTASVSGGSSSGGYYPNPMSAKEREARGSGAFAVANPGPGGPQMGQMHMPMPASQAGFGTLPNPHSPESQGSIGNGSGVLVHTDGGRVPEPQQEIPPTYDSIPRQ